MTVSDFINVANELGVVLNGITDRSKTCQRSKALVIKYNKLLSRVKG